MLHGGHKQSPIPPAGEREREDANIKYEKLIIELEQNPEYRAQLEEKRREKEARNAPLNQAATQEMRGMFAPDRLDADPELRKKVQKSPELTLIGLDHRVRCYGNGLLGPVPSGNDAASSATA